MIPTRGKTAEEMFTEAATKAKAELSRAQLRARTRHGSPRTPATTSTPESDALAVFVTSMKPIFAFVDAEIAALRKEIEQLKSA